MTTEEQASPPPPTTETKPDVEQGETPKEEEEEEKTDDDNCAKKKQAAYATQPSDIRRSGMESSILKFTNVNFTVGKGDKKKYLLTDVNATVKWGRVLASK